MENIERKLEYCAGICDVYKELPCNVDEVNESLKERQLKLAYCDV